MKPITQRWSATKELAVWAIACVAVTLMIGFGFAGWVTAGTAKKMADEAASAARNQLAAAVCAEKFMRSADAQARLAKLKRLEWWDRDDLVVAGGWATMPGEKAADSAVAELCAARLAELPRA